MLNQLTSSRLRVALFPAPDPQFSEHKIRVSVEHNPEWYSQLCMSYQSARSHRRRRGDTRIRRIDIVRILTKLANGHDCRSRYVEDLVDIAEAEVVPF